MRKSHSYKLVKLMSVKRVPREMVIEAWNNPRGPFSEYLHKKYSSLNEAIEEEVEE